MFLLHSDSTSLVFKLQLAIAHPREVSLRSKHSFSFSFSLLSSLFSFFFFFLYTILIDTIYQTNNLVATVFVSLCIGRDVSRL